MTKQRSRWWILWTAVIGCLILFHGPDRVTAEPSPIGPPLAGDNWWEITPEEENPSEEYDSILYSEIPALLHEIETNSDRVSVDVIGKSAGGRNLFLVTIASKGLRDRLEYFKLQRNLARNPDRVLQMLDEGKDFKVTVFINGSIHGNEYPGTDAALRLIQEFAYSDTVEVKRILDNMIILINVCQNPDGRVLGIRYNSNGIDINRDFLTQSQPEARATVGVVAEWNPLIFLDLHGFVDPMLIEPCTAPHNPNYEYDLYIDWALRQGLAMEAELKAQTGFDAQIPFRDFEGGWDDWPPIYAAMYPMYHGAYGHTLETPYRDIRGVNAHYAVVWGALNFVADNKIPMLQDQINIFWRGLNEQSQQLIPEEVLAETTFEQYNELTIQEFPEAYIIPAGVPMQGSPDQMVDFVNYLLYNDIQVERASAAFSVNGMTFPAGTYVVPMDQPKRGLANTILEAGMDVSNLEGLTFYSPPASWSPPLLWGVTRMVTTDPVSVETTEVKMAGLPPGSILGEASGAYALLPDTLSAYRAVNELLSRGMEIHRTTTAFDEGETTYGVGTFILPADAAVAEEIASGYSLDLHGLTAAPEGAVPLTAPRIALYADAGVAIALKDLGFTFEKIDSMEDLTPDGLAAYDLVINNSRDKWEELSETSKAALAAYFEGGGDYIGIREEGITFARDAGQVTDLSFESIPGNGIVRINYNQDDPIGTGFMDDTHAFVYHSVYFTEMPDGTAVSATIAAEDDFFVSGFWPEWETSNAAGKPIILHRSGEGGQDLVLIGIEPSFRGHPKGSFKVIANAIWESLDVAVE